MVVIYGFFSTGSLSLLNRGLIQRGWVLVGEELLLDIAQLGRVGKEKVLQSGDLEQRFRVLLVVLSQLSNNLLLHHVQDLFLQFLTGLFISDLFLLQ